MVQDDIAKIEIDAGGRLHVVPARCSFPLIYREAMEVHWDGERRSLHSPPPRTWSYLRWFQQILAAASEQGIRLKISEHTEWLNVAPNVEAEFRQTDE